MDEKLGRKLVLDELFDLTLYKKLHSITSGDLRNLLGELIVIETKHYEFWQSFFATKIPKLNILRVIKLYLVFVFCWIFRTAAIHLVLEAIEINGAQKYLSIWKKYKNTKLGAAVNEILQDEFKHEDAIVSQQVEKKINPERIRSIFLGLNDGLVEILGAISGLFAAFNNSATVLIAALTIAVAGSLSMGAGAYVASSSEKEVQKIADEKQNFLHNKTVSKETEKAIFPALIVGISYLLGAIVPVLPVLFGARSMMLSLIFGGIMMVIVSLLLSFISGMDIKKRIMTNLIILFLAVGITYLLGILIKNLVGISI